MMQLFWQGEIMHQRSFTTTLVARTAAAAAAVPAAMFGSPPAATAAAPLPVYGRQVTRPAWAGIRSTAFRTGSMSTT